MTRKVIVSSYITLDGKVDSLSEWVAPYDAEPVAAFHSDLLENSDGLLLGRKTYQAFSMIWPPRSGGYSDKINSMAKHVATTTLTDLAWNNSHLIEGDVAEGVAKLKAQDGGDLVVYGGPTLIDTLKENDLIDEYRFLLHPVLFAKGRNLIMDGSRRADLELVEHRVIDPGVVVLTYRTANK